MAFVASKALDLDVSLRRKTNGIAALFMIVEIVVYYDWASTHIVSAIILFS